MRLDIFTLATVVLVGSVAISHAKAAALPIPKHLYSFTLTLSEDHIIDGPLGQRTGAGITGGNMTSPNGTLIAHAIPGLGGETGVIDKNGNLRIDARVYFQFVDDRKYLFFRNTGTGPFDGSTYSYSRIETDSPLRESWNSYFVVNNITLPNPNLLLADSFYWSTSL